ncbi:MAG: hypothetical protein JW869_05800, partial [Candidatus Omnitrophica bacterium]|nr:hypothetical protein [Candidatus Omnitrophota bacterium]
MQYEVTLVRIREGEKIAYFSIKDLPIPAMSKLMFRPGERIVEATPIQGDFKKKVKVGEYVIIEAERGREYGQVISEPELVSETEIEAPLRKVLRIASRDDLRQIQENKKNTKEALDICEKKISEHKLNMKLVNAEYTFDRSKFIFYFIAEGRVD